LEQGEPKKRLAAFIECVGPRHADSRLETYRADTPEQAAVLNAITDYCQNIAERVKSGCGIIANGTVGTGKTHLLIGAGRKAIAAGFRVSYHNGQKLISDFRSRMGDDDAPSEADILDNLVRPDVLILDDPIRPHGQLSDYQEQLFYVFTEGRYNAMKPTWVSMNVDSREDAIKRIGAAIVDRWKDNALTLAFDWPSYRHAGEFKS
jgi:DNA replication protein DnaC